MKVLTRPAEARDWIEPGEGFGQRPHRDAEILSYVLESRLQHRDSMGNGSVIEAGDLQYMFESQSGAEFLLFDLK